MEISIFFLFFQRMSKTILPTKLYPVCMWGPALPAHNDCISHLNELQSSNGLSLFVVFVFQIGGFLGQKFALLI